VKITAHDERGFYDALYAAHLHASEDDLKTNRDTVLRDLDRPGSTFYERRRLYGAVLRQLLTERLRGRSVLDYGCGLGEWGVLMATEGAHVALLDLSPVAIQIGLRRAAASGVAGHVRGFAWDAADLTCFAGGEFDLIFANAALHHTLKYQNALAELVRVLKPGGKLLLAETYGNNCLLNWLRRARWWLSRQPDEAGEDIILGDRELQLLAGSFRSVEAKPMNLLAMAKRLFRGRFQSPLVRGVLRCLESADDRVLRWFPSLGRYCGEILVVAEK
jgi:ubiquinone/menaquinone biosynthesis C-methylase UbiE